MTYRECATYHRVCSLFLVHVRELDDFRAVSQEGSSEERVQEENVANLTKRNINS